MNADMQGNHSQNNLLLVGSIVAVEGRGRVARLPEVVVLRRVHGTKS